MISKTKPHLNICSLNTPLGAMTAIANAKALFLLEFSDLQRLDKEIEQLKKKTRALIIPGKTEMIESIEQELACYFNGTLKDFKTPLFLIGSPFQREAWAELKKIPYGTTISYGELALTIHNPKAFRAVARANNANRLALIIPCHRVINAKGCLGGYAGGIERKKWLIDHENAKPTPSQDKHRCFGMGIGKEFYAHYHDYEWGIPVHDDQLLFEILILEGAQAGLSWETILKKRQGYRNAFHHFNPIQVAAMRDSELDALLHNENIIRNRLKIYGARLNAQVFLKIQAEFGSFDRYLWNFVNGIPIKNHWKQIKEAPIRTIQSDAISKDLKKRGMTFVGSTIMYAYMQAVGMVNDHTIDCWCYETV